MRKAIVSSVLAALMILAASTTHAMVPSDPIPQSDADTVPRGIVVDYGIATSGLAYSSGLHKWSTVFYPLMSLPWLHTVAKFKDTAIVEVFTLPAGASWSTDEVLAYMADAKVRPANIQECLTLAGVSGQEIGRGGICLGQRLERDSEYGVRYLNVQVYQGNVFGWAELPLGGRWAAGTRFYFVRK